MTLSTARKVAKATRWATEAALLLLASMALAFVLLLTLDPACGPDGNSQRACQEELHRDVAALFTGHR